LLQAVAGRHAQIVDALSGVDQLHFVAGALGEFATDPLGEGQIPHGFGVAVLERANHA
jgi:hypothetical protein